MNVENIINMLQTYLESIEPENRVQVINQLRETISRYSPLKYHPVDCVLWLPAETIKCNDYNPNSMSPAERRLLRTSLLRNGYTQPIVVNNNHDGYTIVDGAHRYTEGIRTSEISDSLMGFIPAVKLNQEKGSRQERIAATIRHNRARGEHHVQGMSEIVRDLHRLGWNNEKISVELGMDKDEVLRLNQLSGLTELFVDDDYSQAWVPSDKLFPDI